MLDIAVQFDDHERRAEMANDDFKWTANIYGDMFD